MPIVVAVSSDSAWAFAILAGLTAVSVAVAAGGAFRPGEVNGPDRAVPFEGPARLGLALCSGTFLWIYVQLAYVSRLKAAHTPVPFDVSQMTPGQWAFLSTVPPLAGFAALLLADALLAGGAGPRRLGITGMRAARVGIAGGLLGTIVVLPLLAWLLSLTEVVYRVAHYAHPDEHELLRVMGESPPGTRAMLIFAAVVVAPFFEETLFRAHVQTLVRSILIRLGGRWERKSVLLPPRGSVPSPESGSAPAILEYAADSAAERRLRPRAALTWLAILIASVLFTAIHPPWMWPPIFFLALCLGYAYERTGSLWTAIVIHALFNATSTWIYLHSR